MHDKSQSKTVGMTYKEGSDHEFLKSLEDLAKSKPRDAAKLSPGRRAGDSTKSSPGRLARDAIKLFPGRLAGDSR